MTSKKRKKTGSGVCPNCGGLGRIEPLSSHGKPSPCWMCHIPLPGKTRKPKKRKRP